MSHRDRRQFITLITSIFVYLTGQILRYKNVHAACAHCYYECKAMDAES